MPHCDFDVEVDNDRDDSPELGSQSELSKEVLRMSITLCSIPKSKKLHRVLWFSFRLRTFHGGSRLMLVRVLFSHLKEIVVMFFESQKSSRCRSGTQVLYP